MTVNRGLFVPLDGAAGTTDVEARLAIAGLVAENLVGTPRSGVLDGAPAVLVTGTTTGWSYDVGSFNAVVNRSAYEGVYLFSVNGTTNVPTIAAPASNSRIDVIYVKQNDTAKGDANNLAILGVANGVAQAVPVAPSLPSGALELARFTVTSSNANTAAASGTQTFPWTALRGLPIPVRSTTERATLTGRDGLVVKRLDLDARGRHLEEWVSGAWATRQGAAAAVPDGFWTITGFLELTRTASGPMVSADLTLTRTGSAITINASPDSALLIDMIPAGFRPATNHYFVGTSNTNGGAYYATPQLIINTGGSLVGRSTSGGPVTIGTGYQLFVSTVWAAA